MWWLLDKRFRFLHLRVYLMVREEREIQNSEFLFKISDYERLILLVDPKMAGKRELKCYRRIEEERRAVERLND